MMGWTLVCLFFLGKHLFELASIENGYRCIPDQLLSSVLIWMGGIGLYQSVKVCYLTVFSKKLFTGLAAFFTVVWTLAQLATAAIMIAVGGLLPKICLNRDVFLDWLHLVINQSIREF